MRKVDFDFVNRIAIVNVEAVLSQWLPNGHRSGNEWISLNPKRADNRLGSFKVNLHNGRWSDFAIGVAGGDLVSLGAYLADLDQVSAARELAAMLGVSPYGR